MAPSKKAMAFASLGVAGLTSRVAPNWLLARSIWITFVALLAVQLLALAAWVVVLWPKYFSPIRHLPTPTGGSYFNGHFRRILKEPSGDPHKDWMKNVPNDGLIRYMGAFNIERVLITSPKGLAEVLTQKSYDFIKPPRIAQAIGNILGIGVLFAEGDEHKRQRKLLQPAFSFRHTRDLYPLFWAKAREMANSITAEVDCQTASSASTTTNEAIEKPTILANDIASRTTLDIIGVAGFSRDFQALADPSNKLNKTYQQIFQPNRSARALQFIGILLPFWLVRRLPVQRNNDVRAASAFIRQTCRDLIKAKREKLEKGEHGVDIMSVALGSGGFTDEELVDQLMTFAAAGHETTASSMTWAIYLLCKHPEIQAKLRKELVAAGLPSPFDAEAGKAVTADLVDRIPYLTAVCNEILRFLPPVSLTLRVASRSGLTILGQPIPKDTTVILAPAATNVSPELWGPDAEEFNPDRWIDKETGQANNTGGASSNYAFLTFIHGPRSCIGQGFARAEFAVLLAGWVRGFETSLPDPSWVAEIGGNVTTKPKGGLKVNVKRVED